MNRLEERYRLVLRLLPASYRQVWEEDMVTAFLASMHTDDPEDADYLADYGRPGWAEVASVAGLAVRLRLGLEGGPSTPGSTCGLPDGSRRRPRRPANGCSLAPSASGPPSCT